MIRTKIPPRTLDLRGVPVRQVNLRLPSELVAAAEAVAEDRAESLTVFVAESLQQRLAARHEAQSPEASLPARSRPRQRKAPKGD